MTYTELTDAAKRTMRRSRVADPALPVRLKLLEMKDASGLTSWRAFAQRHGVSVTLMINVYKGAVDPGPRILRITGYERVVTYRRCKKETRHA